MGYGSAQMPGDRITRVGRERLGQEPRPRGAEVARLAEKGTTCGPVSGQGQGLLTVTCFAGSAAISALQAAAHDGARHRTALNSSGCVP
jgi:hypothetical protein